MKKAEQNKFSVFSVPLWRNYFLFARRALSSSGIAEQVPEKTAVILYDTMWKSTHQMAEAVGEGFGILLGTVAELIDDFGAMS